MIEQPHSALARADRLVCEALNHLHAGDTVKAMTALGQAGGALGFAGNSQTRLIEAINGLNATYNRPDSGTFGPEQPLWDAAFAAVKHAEGPGID